ncbi:MAG TPA: NUDIX hydrolase, partial [Hyalangium sp.]|nr:NUDIX hydrolase [Hyalangium sp.]
TTHEERVRRAGAALLAMPPPPGWRPLGPDDELLRTLLPDEEA